MQKMRRIAFVAGSMVASAAFGQVELFGQIAESPAQLVGSPGSYANSEGSCQLAGGPFFFAEDFDFKGAPTVVSAVRWWGWAADGDCQINSIRSANDGVSSFTVTFYENDSNTNLPGTQVWTSGDISPSIGVDTVLFATAAGAGYVADVYQYTLTLPAPLPPELDSFTFTQRTWVSVSAKSLAGSSWVWASQGAGVTINLDFGTANEWAILDGPEVWTRVLNTGLAFAVLGSLDSDGDGLDDATEIALQSTYACLDINNPDSDGDGLLDGFEVNIVGSNPCKVDTDGDGIPDNLDPDSSTLESPSEQALFAQFVADEISITDLPSFSGPNDNAKSARQNVLISRMDEAASLISQEMYAEALEVLNSVLIRVDGDQSPPDWILDEVERAFVEELVLITIGLIS